MANLKLFHFTTTNNALATQLYSHFKIPHSLSHIALLTKKKSSLLARHFTLSSSVFSAMDSVGSSPSKELPVGLDVADEADYASLSQLLQEFTDIPTIDKAWTFKSKSEEGSQGMFMISQPNLLANNRRKSILSSYIIKESNNAVNFKWGPFPVEVSAVSTMVPSPSGLQLLVVRNSEGDSPTRFEIWGSSEVKKEFVIPRSTHGSVYTDGWFEGISWNSDETAIAYVAEEPEIPKPTFTNLGYKMGGSIDKDCGSWKGQGDWEEDWGETYAGKKQPALFVLNLDSGDVSAVEGAGRSLSVGQVVWAPSIENQHQYLVFVGWPSDSRKLGIKYCYNRPCALYAVRAPSFTSDANPSGSKDVEGMEIVNLTSKISSAFFPRFSPDGKFLVFLSAKSAVDSGAHMATDSLHRIDWPTGKELGPSLEIVDVVPVVMCPDDGCFPGLYAPKILSTPWLSDGYTMILSSFWCSTQAILSVDVLSGIVKRISPKNSNYSWDVLTLDGDNIIAAYSSPIDVPQIKYGCHNGQTLGDGNWSWLDILSPITKCSDKVMSLMSSREFSIMKIPVRNVSEKLSRGASKPFDAIYVSAKTKKPDAHDPLIVVIHGGPHSVSSSSYSKNLAFLCSLGYSLLIVNYRGSLGFGEEALQSLPGKIGSQDVNDVLTAVDHIIDMGLADPSKIAVIGGSHGGFLTAHLIGQAPEKFAAAVARNPVCNIALMIGTSDIPDWCYYEAYGSEGRSKFTEAPSAEHLALFHSKSPISHVSKVKTPTLLLLGAQDLRVPVSNGLQYARALKEKGVDTKVIVFPNDIHPIDRPQSDFESFLNVGVWFRKYCK